MKLASGMSFYSVQLNNFILFNRLILDRFSRLKSAPDRQTHFFHGRYENTYTNRADLPEIEPVLQTANTYAATLLQHSLRKIKSGFWFNEMHPGHVTTAHSHADDNKLLSCVYY